MCQLNVGTSVVVMRDQGGFQGIHVAGHEIAHL